MEDFIVLDSIYGKFIVARNCSFQAESLVKTGRTHIEDELNNIFLILGTLPKDSIIIDGGANIGFFMIPVAQKNKEMKIIGFEPQIKLFQALSGSIALNNLNNCYLHNLALGEKLEKLTLPEIDYKTPQDYGMIKLENQNLVENSYLKNRSVDVVTIDSMNLPGLDFLKLDVEGYEKSAILGGLETIKKYRPWIWVEYFISGKESIKEALKDIPYYEFYIVDPLNMICVPQEKTQKVNLSGLITA